MSTGQRLPPFRSTSGANYRAFYRAACDLHERYNKAIPLDDESWAEYMEDVQELAATYGNNEFLIELLVTVTNELERESKSLTDDA